MIKTFFPLQWPPEMPQTKKRSIATKADWAVEYGKIADIARLEKFKKCIVTSNYDPEEKKMIGDNRGVVVLMEDHRGRKFHYICDKYFAPSMNLQEIRKRLDAERAMARLSVRVLSK